MFEVIVGLIILVLSGLLLSITIKEMTDEK